MLPDNYEEKISQVRTTVTRHTVLRDEDHVEADITDHSVVG